MTMKIMLLLAVALLLSSLAVAQDGGEDDKTAEAKPSSWVCVTEEAAFSPRDTAEDCVFDGKMWISNGYYHGGVLTRDLWWTTDGETWTRVSEATPYDGYAEMELHRWPQLDAGPRQDPLRHQRLWRACRP